MKPVVALLALTVCGLSARAAHADQCAWVSPRVAERASQALAGDAVVLDYCQPCGEVAPGEPRPVGQVSLRSVGDGYQEVVLDGRGIDLAYTYLRTAPDRFENLAALSGCPATGVSARIGVAPRDQTIAPAAAPTRFASPPPPASVAPAPTPIPSHYVTPAPPVHVVQLSVAPIAPAWLIALAGATSALAAGLALVVVSASRRRRSSSLPRALALVDRKPDSGSP